MSLLSPEYEDHITRLDQSPVLCMGLFTHLFCQDIYNTGINVLRILICQSTARNLYQLNANEVPLTLHYGFEGRIIILHKNPYRWGLQYDAKGMGTL